MLLVSEPSLGRHEKAAVAKVIDSGWITMGHRVRAFEQAFAQTHQVADAVAVSSCTTGLHLVMGALGIGPGDEVLVPSLTFVATANSVIYAGATPVFVDIESLDVPLISPYDAAAKCTARTKAVVVMHYGGYLVDGAVWREFARQHGLYLIEDAAHAAGLDRPGIFGDAAVFSFFSNKNMTTAEGGMVVARDDGILVKVRQMRCHGITSGTTQRLASHAVTYDVTMLGYNYRMDELRASIGLVQLKNLKRWNDTRQALANTYRRLLAQNCPGVAVPFSRPRASSCHILPALLPEGVDRQAVVSHMWDAGVQTSMHYPPIHEFSWYRARFPLLRLPRTEEYCRRELTLPLHPKLTDLDVDVIVCALARALKANEASISPDLHPASTESPAPRPVLSGANRVIDVIFAIGGLVAFAPIMLLIAAAILVESGRPVFFSQVRLGVGGRQFRMYKFDKFDERTPTTGHPLTLENDPRLTRVGRLLVRTKLDELPQFWNVLKGDMSVVGPRPESLAFRDSFQGRYRAILDHKPGIFGPSQVLFRDEAVLYRGHPDVEQFYREVLFPKKAAIDLAYFTHRTLLRDLSWIARCVIAVFGWSSLTAERAGLIEASMESSGAGDLPGLNPTPSRTRIRLKARARASRPAIIGSGQSAHRRS
jgi:dTDP-4-amino-4,6-dideoxygalactose transaminase/lipopolysaccharide/colanic/teichoic acid biosynthesis glycosyltransferase